MTADKPWRQIPSVNEILAEPAVEEILRSWPRERVVEAVRDLTASVRRILAQEASDNEALGLFSSGERLAAGIRERLEARSLRRVINATGVVLHTNLGRAILPEAAREALAEAAFHHSNLEFNLETGARGSRYSHVASLLTRITGAEAALVVNNNAAAVLLCLETLAAGREVIISRGELVEIGGSFRVPDVMARSGARLVEVGTTNKTHFRDYLEAITENTGLLLKVHTSNYRIVGFAEEVSLEEMTRLGRERGIPVMNDLGSGVLVDLAPYGLPHEPTVQEAVKTGADLVTFSGDKLLGGPQAGIIVGRADLVIRIAQNPLTRALRIDKMTLAALEATLRLYLAPEAAVKQIPTLARLTEPIPAVEERARRLADLIRKRLGDRVGVEVVRDDAEAGGGSLPTFQIPSAAVAVELGGRSLEQTEAALRRQKPAVIGHIQKGRLLFNARTLEEDELALVAEALGRSLEVEG